MDKLVVASYFPWYGTPTGPTGGWLHWKGMPGEMRLYYDTPPWALYDSRAPATVVSQSALAATWGIDAFAISWWGHRTAPTPDEPENINTPIILNNSSIKCAIQFEAPGIADKGMDVGAELFYALNTYSGHSNYLKINGLPAVFIYNPTGAGNAAFWTAVMNTIRGSIPCFAIADWVDQDGAGIFDGVYFWGPANVYQQSPANLASLYASGRQIATNAGKVFGGTVFPGYNDEIIRPQTAFVPRQNGRTYMDTWRIANASGADFIHIMSWNEWHEASEIESGDQYLNFAGVGDGVGYGELTKTLCAGFK